MTKRKRFILSVLYAMFVSAVAHSQSHTVAMTVDDLPFVSGDLRLLTSADGPKAVEVNKRILKAFFRHHIPATGFVVGKRAEILGASVSKNILEQWTHHGFDLGNHLYSHPDINLLSVDEIEQEIVHTEPTFAPLLEHVSRKPQFLRFPYLHTGDTKEKHDAVAQFMQARGYKPAPCTIDNSDYTFNASYVLAQSRHDNQAAKKIRAAYLTYTATEIDYYTALNKYVLGYEPPHIMLLHDSPLNGDTINQVISLFEKRGYRFISLTEAVRDPAYSIPETYITSYGPMWGYRWAHELHIKVDGSKETDPPAWIEKYAKTAAK